ncbi:MAG: peptidoglycan DD-metalloendopeptidase family protein [Oscillospiraceae bacterium]|nr:peptidoglycan DD-metalloendopeptidase family protein [Oscillospiraceae bacterium]
MKLKLKRSFSLIIAVVVLFAAAVLPSARTEAEIRADMQQIQQRIDAQRAEVNQLRAQQASQQALLPALDAEVQAVQEKINLIQVEVNALTAQIDELNARIRELNTGIEESQVQIELMYAETQERDEQIQAMQELLMQRLRQQYINGPVSNLQLLLASDDLSGVLTVTEFISRQAEADAQLREDLEEEMAHMAILQQQLRTEQQHLEEQREQLQTDTFAVTQALLRQRQEQSLLDEEIQRIDEVRSEIQGIINAIGQDARRIETSISRGQGEYEAAQREINAIINQRIQAGEIGNVSNTGQMVWPFPHHGARITSRFGASEPFRGGRVHRGVDVSIANNWYPNWTIHAALCGVVAAFGFNSSMGNYVVIYHGHFGPANGRIQTVYMHLRTFAPELRRDMPISAGQHIGMMGNTGNSTGPHLHFQVDRFNADGSRTAINPMQFVSGAPYLIN